MVKHIRSGGLKGDGVLFHTEAFTVPLLGEIVSVIDEARTAPNDNCRAALDILGLVVLNVAHVHAGAVSKDGGLGELLSLEELREGVVARVGFVDFLNLNSVVTEEIVEAEVFVTAIV